MDKNTTIPKPHSTYSQRINRGGTPWFTWKEETFFISLDLSHTSRLNCEPSLLCHCLPTPWRPWARNTESIHRNKQTGSKLIFTQLLKACKIKVKKIWRGYWKRKKNLQYEDTRYFFLNIETSLSSYHSLPWGNFQRVFLVLMSHFLTPHLWRVEAFWKWKANKIAFNALRRGYFRFLKAIFFLYLLAARRL